VSRAFSVWMLFSCAEASFVCWIFVLKPLFRNSEERQPGEAPN